MIGSLSCRADYYCQRNSGSQMLITAVLFLAWRSGAVVRASTLGVPTDSSIARRLLTMDDARKKVMLSECRAVKRTKERDSLRSKRGSQSSSESLS